MTFDWRDFFLFAHQLRNETEECKQRTSIGRAYYYAYNAALIEARKRGFDPKDPSLQRINGGVHQKLWGWYLLQSDQDLLALGDSGNTLKGRRTSADYYSRLPTTLQLVQRQLDETRDFELLLARIKSEPDPPPLP
jgi:hypothetical protein